MSTGKQRIWVFLVILTYVVIAVVGFFIAYLVKGELFHQTKSSQAPTPQASKQVQSNKPTGWKIYTNTDDKFSFSYPPNDTIQTKSYGFGVTSLAIKEANGNLDFQILLMPKTIAMAVGQNFDSIYALPNNTTKVIKNPLSQDNTTTENFTKTSSRSVNGLRTVDYQSIPSNAPSGTQPEIGSFIEVGSNLVLISTGKSNKEKLEELLSSVTS